MIFYFLYSGIWEHTWPTGKSFYFTGIPLHLSPLYKILYRMMTIKRLLPVINILPTFQPKITMNNRKPHWRHVHIIIIIINFFPSFVRFTYNLLNKLCKWLERKKKFKKSFGHETIKKTKTGCFNTVGVADCVCTKNKKKISIVRTNDQ